MVRHWKYQKLENDEYSSLEESLHDDYVQVCNAKCGTVATIH